MTYANLSYTPNEQAKYTYGNKRKNQEMRASALIVLVIYLGCINNFLGIGLAAVIASILICLTGRFATTPIVYITFASFIVAFLHAQIPNATPFDARIEEAARAFGFLAFALLIGTCSQKILAKTVIYMSYFSFIPVPLYLAIGAFGRADESGNFRYTSFFIHPNHVGYVAVILIACVLVGRRQIFGENDRKFTFILTGLFLALGFSESSNGLATCGLILVLYALKYQTLKKKLQYLVVFLCATILLWTLTPVISSLIVKFANVDFREIYIGSINHQFGGHDSSLAWRLSYWSAIWREQSAQDLLTQLNGHGGGSSSKGNYVFYFMYKDPHNDFLAFLLDYGYIWGTLLAALLLLPTFWAAGGSLMFFSIFLPMQTGNIASSFPVISIYFLATALLIKIRQNPHTEVVRQNWTVC
jgi:hypothetical protein